MMQTSVIFVFRSWTFGAIVKFSEKKLRGKKNIGTFMISNPGKFHLQAHLRL